MNASTYFSENLRLPNAVTPQASHGLLVIDAKVQPLDHLLKAANPGWQVIVIDAHGDGVEQISNALAAGKFNHLAIVAHGQAGRVQLGNSSLNPETISFYRPLLAEWAVGQVDFWSCQVGQDPEFISRLSELTGARISASQRVLGQGIWAMDGAEPPFEIEALASWPGVLALPVNPSFESGFDGWTIIDPVLPPGFDFESNATIDSTSESAAPTDGSAFAKLVLQSPNRGVPRGETAFGVTIRSSDFALAAGENISADFQPFEDESDPATDDTAVRILLFDAASDSPVATLIDGTFNEAPGWLTTGTTAPAAGNYYLTVQIGSFDETFGRRVGAELYVDNIRNGDFSTLTADIVDVDNLAGPLDAATVIFSRPIDPDSFGLEDLKLTREEAINDNLIEGTPGLTLTPIPGVPNGFEIGGLGAITDDLGLYRLFVDTTGVTTPGGVPGIGNAFESWSNVEDLPPVVTVTPTVTEDTTPALTGTVDDGTATVSVTVAGTPYSAANNGDGTWTLPDNVIDPALAVGTYDVAVTATDGNGNVGGDTTTDELQIIEDGAPLTVSVDPLTTDDTTPTLTGTVDDGTAAVSVTVAGTPYSAINNGDGTWTLPDNVIAPPLTVGTYDVAVTATDGSGNVSSDNTSDELEIVDELSPIASVTVNPLSTLDATPELTGTVDSTTASISVAVAGTAYGAVNNGDGTWTLPDDAITAPLAPGLYDVAVTATSAGGESTDGTLDELRILQPTIGYFNFNQYTRSRLADDGIEIPFTPEELGGFQLPLLFDETDYLARYGDVAAAVRAGDFVSGYDHFLDFGLYEGRDPSILYSEAFYRSEYPDVDAAIRDGFFRSGLEHFLKFGSSEGRNPSAFFNEQEYLAAFPDIQAKIDDGSFFADFESGFDHYIEFGYSENRLPPQLSYFDEGYYLGAYPDVAASVEAGEFLDGLQHYIRHGQGERRDPSANFNESNYLERYPDVVPALGTFFSSGFEHFILNGRAEGRISTAVF